MELRKEILDTLEQDARISPKELAIRLGADEVDVVNEVAAMEQEGIICGYLTLIDWDKTSVDKVTALIEVKVTPTKGKAVRCTMSYSVSTALPRELSSSHRLAQFTLCQVDLTSL